MNNKADIALIGLAVMGQNLILNMADKGFKVAAYNRTVSKVDEFINSAAKGHPNVVPAYSLEELVSLLKRPRKIMLMVKAGAAVDNFIELLKPHLEQGDIIIDGGNSLYEDSQRRVAELADAGFRFIGTGVSGGEEGARHGPSMMPGGSVEAWEYVKDIFESICAKANDGSPCCAWIGDGGAGHYVKMVHNGIEYGDMQLICEAYHIMQAVLGLSYDELGDIFSLWNQSELNSYLIEITADILRFKDEDGSPLLEKILDTAGQKGTGKWTSISALNLGIPVTLISEAVYARCLSALKEERVFASKLFKTKVDTVGGESLVIEDVRKALYASKIISYAQGFMLLREAAKEYSWKLDYGEIASIWRGGCIIRSVFLDKISKAYESNPNLKNILLDSYFANAIEQCQDSWRKVIATAICCGVPLPALSTSLSFFDSYRSDRLPANLLQAQRDYFGAHSYERVDKPRGTFFHTNWTGQGGKATS